MNLATLGAAAALPEIFLALAACAILLLTAFSPPQQRGARGCMAGVAALLAAAVLAGGGTAGGDAALNNMFIADPLARLLKVSVCILSAAAFVYGRRYNIERGIFSGEYYVLGLFAVTGMMVVSSANHLLTLYLGLELMSLCLYAMVACRRDGKLASEAAMKYFVLGALASSMLLYGMSLLYGLSGSLELTAIAAEFGRADTGAAHALAVVFIVCAIAFKLGAAPFHMWLPDVYHGAPTSTTAFLAAAPKLAAFALLMRLLAGGLEQLFAMWQQMLLLLALLSVAAGNIIAIAQTNFKRMLAYSAVSHMGFFLFGIAGGGAQGYAAALFYVLIYALMGLGAFGMILLLSDRAREFDRLDDLKGLSTRDPWSAFLLMILMLSMAGIPPTAGFFAKLAVIQTLVRADLIWAAAAAVLLAVVGAFYYLRVIKLMYFDSAEGAPAPAPPAPGMKWLLSFNALIIVAILPWINTLIEICSEVILRFAV